MYRSISGTRESGRLTPSPARWRSSSSRCSRARRATHVPRRNSYASSPVLNILSILSSGCTGRTCLLSCSRRYDATVPAPWAYGPVLVDRSLESAARRPGGPREAPRARPSRRCSWPRARAAEARRSEEEREASWHTCWHTQQASQAGHEEAWHRTRVRSLAWLAADVDAHHAAAGFRVTPPSGLPL